MRFSIFAVLVATASVLVSAEAALGLQSAAVTDFTPGNQTALAAAQNDIVVGWKFEVVNLQPDQELLVADLGYWISGPAAVNLVQHPITIWDDVGGPGGTPLVVAQTIVTPGRAPKQNGGPTSQWFRWRGLDGIAGGVLEQGKTYTIGAYYTRPVGQPLNPGDPWITNPMNVQWDPHVNFLQDAFTNANAGDVYPDQTNGMGSTPLFGPNFKFDVVFIDGLSFCVPGADAALCPCFTSAGQIADADHGCGNSVFTGGAHLAVSGSADTANDTLTFTASEMTFGTSSIFLQGSGNILPGVLFGDGRRCAGGTLIRLGQKLDTAPSDPSPLDAETKLGFTEGDPPISALGGVSPGDTRIYQTYYRNPNASWCPPQTFNATQAQLINWY